MPQDRIAVDAKGNKVRWDGTAWVPFTDEDKERNKAIDFVKKNQESLTPQKPGYTDYTKRKVNEDDFLGIFRSALSGAQAGASTTLGALLKAADFISDNLGIKKSDAARMLAKDLRSWSETNKKKGTRGVVGKIGSGLGRAAVDIPTIASMGPAGLPVHGAIVGGSEGGVKGALTGAAGGALMGGALRGMSNLATPARVGASAALGAATTPGGLEDRIAGAATMGGLGLMGGPKKMLVEEKPTRGALKPKAETTPELKELIGAIKSAKSRLPELEELRTAERGKRLSKSMEIREQTEGMEGFRAEKAALGGELPRLQFESIFDKVTPKTRTSLFEQVKKSPLLTDWEKIQARDGLERVMNETGGAIPQPKQLELLHRVFGEQFTGAIKSKMDSMSKLKEYVETGINIPRTLMSVGDVSGGFRQGVFFSASHPVLFGRALKNQFKYLASQKSYDAAAKEIASRKTFPLMRKYGLDLMEMDSALNLREERMMGASPLEKVPVVGGLVRGSNRAYTGMLNQLRADVFDSLVRDAGRMGIDPYSTKNSRVMKDIANLVNTGTGRGSLGKTFGESAVVLNATLFSPRLVASRLRLLNPVYYARLSSPARKEALRSMLAMIAAGSTIAAIAKTSGLAEVETDPRSSDFMKLRIGKVRVDPWGGFQQYVRFAAQMAAGETKSSTTGKITDTNRLDLTERFLTYKEAPAMSFLTDILRGKTAMGEKLNFKNMFVQRALPMAWQDMAEIIKEEPELAPLGLLGFLGFGIQTYEDKKKATSIR